MAAHPCTARTSGCDLARAGRGFLILPEWRARFERVDDMTAGGERRVAMRRPHRHQHDRLVGLECAAAMYHQRVENLPTRRRLAANCLQLLLRHARVMFKGHGGDACALADVAHRADEYGGSAAIAGERRGCVPVTLDLSPGIEWHVRHTNFHLLRLLRLHSVHC